MNRLSNERRAQVLTLLTEGTGINSVVRITGIAKTTVLWLPAEAGRFCSAYQACRLPACAVAGSRRTRSGRSWAPSKRTPASRTRATCGGTRRWTRTAS